MNIMFFNAMFQRFENIQRFFCSSQILCVYYMYIRVERVATRNHVKTGFSYRLMTYQNTVGAKLCYTHKDAIHFVLCSFTELIVLNVKMKNKKKLSMPAGIYTYHM